jgi:hypothetical protein
MATLNEIRSKHPEYSDMSDQEFADKFYKKFYADIPREQFNQQIGFNAQKTSAQPQGFFSGVEDPFVGLNKAAERNKTIDKRQALNQAAMGLAALPFAEFAPFAGAIPNALARIGGSTAVMTAANALDPNNWSKLKENALQNAGINTLAESVSPVIGGAMKVGKALVSPLASTTYAQKLMQYLGKGAKSNNENAQELAKDIYQTHQMRRKQYQEGIIPILAAHGEKEIYPIVNPSGIHGERQIPDFDLGNTNKQLLETFDTFKSKPTIENAHEFQKELGVEQARLSLSPKKDEYFNEINNIRNARETIKNKIGDTMYRFDPDSSSQYRGLSDLYRDYVAPVKADKELHAIAKGKETNPKNIHLIFEHPTAERRGEETVLGPLQKVINDLPESAKGRILFSKAGGYKTGLTEKSLLNVLNDAKNSGYGSYFTPQIEEMVRSLSGKMSNKSGAKAIGKLAAGALAGHTVGNIIGSPGITEFIGAGLGHLAPSGKSAYLKAPTETDNALAQLARLIYKPAIRIAGNEEVNNLNQ